MEYRVRSTMCRSHVASQPSVAMNGPFPAYIVLEPEVILINTCFSDPMPIARFGKLFPNLSSTPTTTYGMYLTASYGVITSVLPTPYSYSILRQPLFIMDLC